MTNRPEPISSPSSAKAPLISNPDGASDHRAITKGVSNITKVTQGKDSGKSKGGRKKQTKPKEPKVIGPKTIAKKGR